MADANAAADVAASFDAGPVALAPPLAGFGGTLTLLLLFVKLATAPFVALPLPAAAAAAAACSCVKFAFCSSTLWDKRKDRKIFVRLEGYFG